MSPLSITILAMGMSVDALAAAIGRGADISKPCLVEALLTGLVFGSVEAVTPLIGWATGVAANGFIADIDHWVAFVLLSAVGGHMIVSAMRRSPVPLSTRNSRRLILFATAVGTSIDAMVVGVSLAFVDANIIAIALAIGVSTFAMSAGGVMAGRYIGARFGKWAEMAGGVAVLCIGLSILARHLGS